MSTDRTLPVGVCGGRTRMLSDGFVAHVPVELQGSCMTAWRSLSDSANAVFIFSRVGPARFGALRMEHSLSRLSALEAQHSFLGRLATAGGFDMTMAGSDM